MKHIKNQLFAMLCIAMCAMAVIACSTMSQLGADFKTQFDTKLEEVKAARVDTVYEVQVVGDKTIITGKKNGGRSPFQRWEFTTEEYEGFMNGTAYIDPRVMSLPPELEAKMYEYEKKKAANQATRQTKQNAYDAAKANPKGWITNPLVYSKTGCKSQFKDIVTDNSGNCYAVVEQEYRTKEPLSVTIDGIKNDLSPRTITKCDNYIVKYNSSGKAVWSYILDATSISDVAYYTDPIVDIRGVALNSKNELIAIVDPIAFLKENSHRDGVAVKEDIYPSNTLFVVKFDTNGKLKPVIKVPMYTEKGQALNVSINKMAMDNQDNIYLAGYLGLSLSILEKDLLFLGKNVNTYVTAGLTPFVAKLNPEGTPLWINVANRNDGESAEFNDMTIDKSGNLVAVGCARPGKYSFGNNVSITFPAIANADKSKDIRFLMVKYNADGKALWAKSASCDNLSQNGTSVATDSKNNIYAIVSHETDGRVVLSASSDFGNGVSLSIKGYSGLNKYEKDIVVKYDANGIAQWQKSGEPDCVVIEKVAVDNSDVVHLVGNCGKGFGLSDMSPFTFGGKTSSRDLINTLDTQKTIPFYIKMTSNGNALSFSHLVLGDAFSGLKVYNMSLSNNLPYICGEAESPILFENGVTFNRHGKQQGEQKGFILKYVEK